MKSRRMRTALIGSKLTIAALLLASCTANQGPIEPTEAEEAQILTYVTTDKARYAPGDKIQYNLKLASSQEGGKIRVQYRHLDEVIEEKALNWDGSPELTWEWTPPTDDFKGYMTEIYLEQDKDIVDHENIAVDVSSDWGKFPRYGYLADFMAMDDAEQAAVIERLNRFRINGLQFYDWQWKHHIPLKTDSGKPAAEWPDIANRPVSFDTVKRYIDLAHGKNMKAMNYNLLFGAYEDAEQDGVKREWGLFKDPLGRNQDHHPLPDSWASNIMLVNPANEEWQQYLFRTEKETFEHLPFDGWHVDQLGDRGTLYDAEGNKVNLQEAYASFLLAAKEAVDVDYVMNAVGQFGQAFIAQTPVKFLYTEVWGGHPQFRNLKEIVDQNLKFSKGKLNTVFAAYMNYNYSNSQGEFNAPGVLLADAVMFASGASHLELGENMLSKEYFPHKNLKITEELERQLTVYYDFLTAYQNLLRDGVEEIEIPVTSTVIGLSTQPESGKVWQFAKRKGDQDILHLINFTSATTMEWNDTNATQAEPQLISDLAVSVETDRKVRAVWMATPDLYGGSPVQLEFEQRDDQVELGLPTLKYWDMIVIEYES
ncbi:glycoside hydrolase family 66 protein [Cohnella algarum]|uniref:glycoside hydrolase family 66 protein n=1 Tax=Cohnella algarum TaxID=2044859 RepID=UPI001967A0E5|nr:glycoside hydrolase family 66 protein [Cohnella algarum]MBN2982320.1 glycoside hydrolase family 66 protein [Cohnella algarum]